MMRYTKAQAEALGYARHLAEHGVPIFVAPPDKSPVGFRLPKRWQHTAPDPDIVSTWEPGMALCAVMGHVVDAIDIDPRNGGDRAALNGSMPTVYGEQSTPSGGTHHFIASLGIPNSKAGNGIDIQAGVAGQGHGFVFLAPTERPSKVTGEPTAYRWITPPDIELVAILGDDGTAGELRTLIQRSATAPYDGPAYDGPAYADLTAELQAQADSHANNLIAGWKARFKDALGWEEGVTDEAGRGWERLTMAWAWALARMVVTPWLRIDEDEADLLYYEVLPAEIEAAEECKGKWDHSVVVKAAREPVECPAWPSTPEEVFGSSFRSVNVADESAALRWLRDEIGQGKLSGVLRRGTELVHTPRIGEHGYVPPKDESDSLGPAQVQRIDALELAARIDHGYTVERTTPRSSKPVMFPQTVAARAAATPDLLGNVKELRGVTHTPVIRRDGSVLTAPGYDPASGMLYLPEPGVKVPVPDRPTRPQVAEAGSLLLSMLQDFPFITPHDCANYLGALLTPLLRPLVPPPYKLIAIGAPQRGSGKSLLAWVVRELHGGVFKSDFPTTEDELRKYVTATLETTTGPVAQFDNVTGVLKSAVLDGLLSSPEWSDRRLGVGTSVTLPNDRLWVVTGNNLHIGGDLERRTLWVTINPNMERPEERHNFAIPNLEAWVSEHRGELLGALLTLVRAWVVAGKPMDEAPESTNFGRWIAALRGILDHADLGDSVGVVGHEESKRAKADPDDAEWGGFLAAVYEAIGEQEWTTSALLRKHVAPAVFEARQDQIDEEDLPGDIAERLERSTLGASKSLGRWLSFREERWAGGYSVRNVGDSRGSKLWAVVRMAPLGDS